MKSILLKYKSFILYGIFGVATTVINIITYSLCARTLGMPMMLSNVIAWCLAVAFAYITNRKWVFESPNYGGSAIFKEIVSFITCRLATGLLDMAFMYVTVEWMKLDDVWMKLFANVIVIICNYVASKLVIFKAKEENV